MLKDRPSGAAQNIPGELDTNLPLSPRFAGASDSAIQVFDKCSAAVTIAGKAAKSPPAQACGNGCTEQHPPLLIRPADADDFANGIQLRKSPEEKLASKDRIIVAACIVGMVLTLIGLVLSPYEGKHPFWLESKGGVQSGMIEHTRPSQNVPNRHQEATADAATFREFH